MRKSAEGPLIGREALLAALASLLREERLVTLVGPGGIGKTRLAREASRTPSGAKRSGGSGGDSPPSLRSSAAWVCCDASAAISESGIADAVSAALLSSEPEDAGVDVVDRIGRALLARGPIVLWIDELDGAVAAAPVFDRWLGMAPELRILTTSRERLGLAAEVVVDVPPLDPEAAGTLLRTLSERAGRAVTAEEERFVATIASLLDGIPLALSLAASRIGVMGARALAHRLQERMDVLRRARPQGLVRHTAMSDAIEFSWALLRAWERDALAQCAVFRGGFDLEAAEAVIELPPASPEVIDVVSALRDKSLLYTIASSGDVRLAMYSVVHAFADERFRELPAELSRATERRHTEHYVRRGAACAARRDADAHRTVLNERENLLAVVERALGRGPVSAAAAEPALRALLVLAPVLLARGPLSTYGQTLDHAVTAMRGSGADPSLLVRALAARAWVLRHLGRGPAAIVDLREALTLADRIGDPALQGDVAVRLARMRVDEPAADRAQIEALCALAARGDPQLSAERLGVLGDLAAQEGDQAGALDAHERAVATLSGSGGSFLEVAARRRLATALFDAAQIDRARSEVEIAIRIAREIEDRLGGALAESLLSMIEEASGNADRARELGEHSTAALAALGVPASERADRPLAVPPDALAVGADGDFFRPPGGESVSLRRRPPLRRLLARLAKERAAGPRSVAASELIAEGWPGERMIADAGAHRVRVAIATLRKMGMRDAIETTPDGYRLRPSIALRLIEL